jgi:hypothetical protein
MFSGPSASECGTTGFKTVIDPMEISTYNPLSPSILRSRKRGNLILAINPSILFGAVASAFLLRSCDQ